MAGNLHEYGEIAEQIRALIERRGFMAPHCDQRVLHAPGECWACDGFPDWQQCRQMQMINFTGQYDDEKTICPSEVIRDINTINMWPGNRPQGPR